MLLLLLLRVTGAEVNKAEHLHNSQNNLFNGSENVEMDSYRVWMRLRPELRVARAWLDLFLTCELLYLERLMN